MSEAYHLLDDNALNELLARRRSNLMRLESQSAIYPSGQEPLDLYNQRQGEQQVVEQLLAEQARRRSVVREAMVQPVQSGADAANQGAAASNGLLALSELMRIPSVRAALVAFRTDFQIVSSQINDLASYKKIHDLFQQIEGFYEQLSLGCKRLPNDDSAWDDIEANEPGLQDVTDQLLRTVAQAAFASKESPWVRRLDRTRNELRSGVESSSAKDVQAAVQRMYDVIDREISRVNTRLVEVARALHFDMLLAALEMVRRNMGAFTLAPEAARQFYLFVQGLDALHELEVRLRLLVDYHDTFQSLDDELRRVRDTIDHDPTELEIAWIDIKPLSEQLVAANQPHWSAKVSENSVLLDAALAAGEWNKTRRVFLRYRSHINRSFTQVDKDLLDLCEQLQDIGRPLSMITQMIE